MIAKPGTPPVIIHDQAPFNPPTDTSLTIVFHKDRIVAHTAVTSHGIIGFQYSQNQYPVPIQSPCLVANISNLALFEVLVLFTI